jgi:hypothetical protein
MDQLKVASGLTVTIGLRLAIRVTGVELVYEVGAKYMGPTRSNRPLWTFRDGIKNRVHRIHQRSLTVVQLKPEPQAVFGIDVVIDF